MLGCILEEISSLRKVKLSSILHKFFQFESLPHENPNNYILRIQTELGRNIILDHKELPEDSFFQETTLKGIKFTFPEIVRKVEFLRMSTEKLFTIIAGGEKNIIKNHFL